MNLPLRQLLHGFSDYDAKFTCAPVPPKLKSELFRNLHKKRTRFQGKSGAGGRNSALGPAVEFQSGLVG
jgi:hypothetical protein